MLAATCTEDGNIEYWRCEICDKLYSDINAFNEITGVVIQKLGHNLKNAPAKDATCTTVGWEAYEYCSRCDYTTYSEIEAFDHVIPSDWISSGMYHRKYCETCNDVVEEKDHNFDNDICTVCNMRKIDIYNDTYGYEYFAKMDSATDLQRLYNDIDNAVTAFHTSNLNAENNLLATFDYKEYNINIDEALMVWNIYRCDKPLFYWLSNAISYDEKNLYIQVNEAYSTGAVREEYNEFLYDKIDTFIAPYKNESSAYMIALALHDAIIEQVNYVYDEDGNPSDEYWAHNICGVFESTGAVCEGYARSFQLLLNMFDINNIFVTGDSNGEAHAWNLVQLNDNNWYWYDLTWDDTPNLGWGISYDHYCKTDDDFLSTHTIDSSNAIGLDFLYDLPGRSKTAFSNKETKFLDTFSFDGCEYTVIGYNAVMLSKADRKGSITIPESFKYQDRVYDVIAICAYDKQNNSFSRVLGEEVTQIDVPKTIKYIHEVALTALSPSSALESINVHSDNQNYVSDDDVLYTRGYDFLMAYPPDNKRTAYTIHEETQWIGIDAFQFVKHLETLTIGKNTFAGAGYFNFNGNTMIGIVWGGIGKISSALAGKKELLIDNEHPDYKVKDGIIFNSDYTILLGLAKSTEALSVPESVVTIRANAFKGHTELKSVTISNNVQSIENNAFMGCSSLKSITLPNSVSELGEWAFAGCSSLSEIILSDMIKRLDNYTFDDCTALTKILIPHSIEYIGQDVFRACFALTIYCEASEQPNDWSNEWNVNGWYNGQNVKSPVVWNCKNNDADEYGYEYAVIDGIRYSFKNGIATVIRQSSDLGIKITIPSKVNHKNQKYVVMKIEDNAFSNNIAFSNTKLLSVVIEEGVTSIGDFAFLGCSSLTSITIPNSVTYISDYAFYDCSSLTSINFNGTKAQWNRISKGSYWNGATGYYTVTCTDGTIAKS